MNIDQITNCKICGKGLAHAGIPIFYQVKIQTFGLDRRAIETQRGLEMMLGDAAPLARVFAPDPHIAKPVGEESTVLVCQSCAVAIDAPPFICLMRD